MGDAFERGIELFNTGHYFEAHEEFEDVWRKAEGELRLLCQGLVQVCAGLVKHQRDLPEPACTLLAKGLSRLEATPLSCRPDVNIGRLIGDLKDVVRALRMRVSFEPPVIRRL
jgi:Uncharacterized conserved protein